MKKLQSVREYLAKGNRAQWCLFFLFAFVLFLKTMIFHLSVYHSYMFSSLWTNPCEFFRFWGGKIVPVLFLSSFVFLFKRYWWTIVVNILVDLWAIANLFYYKANALFLSYETMKMIDNLNGFWDSLYSYVGWDITSFVIITVLYSFIIVLALPSRIKMQQLNWFFPIMILSVSLMFLNMVFYNRFYQGTWGPQNNATKEVREKLLKGEDFKYFFPFGTVYYYAKIETWSDYNSFFINYTKDQSIISTLPACFIYNIIQPTGKLIELSNMQVKEVSKLFNNKSVSYNNPKNNLILILFESMESWPLFSICDIDYMPNLNSRLSNDNVLVAYKIKSQVKHGNSADGQMIDATGVLPIASGATCIMYGHNCFPSISEPFKNASIINPSSGIWRQSTVTYSYQFKELIEPDKNEHWDDIDIINQTINYIDTIEQPFSTLCITVSSHVPFSRGFTHPKHKINNMPDILSAYLNCVMYTDSCIGVLFQHLEEKDMLKNTTVVITGDHTIFRGSDKEIDNYAKANNIDMQTGHTFTPLIIYSQLIKQNIQITDTCYQMDIYPTIMHLIGCEDYYWKGFGVNLMDSTARNNRQISEEEAYRLSDLLIRSNAFELYKQGKLFDAQTDGKTE